MQEGGKKGFIFHAKTLYNHMAILLGHSWTDKLGTLLAQVGWDFLQV